jgi:hypothetical protein
LKPAISFGDKRMVLIIVWNFSSFGLMNTSLSTTARWIIWHATKVPALLQTYAMLFTKFISNVLECWRHFAGIVSSRCTNLRVNVSLNERIENNFHCTPLVMWRRKVLKFQDTVPQTPRLIDLV